MVSVVVTQGCYACCDYCTSDSVCHMPAAARSLPVAVIGAGAMGSRIAQIAALAGHQVHLVDTFEGAAVAARDHIASALSMLAAKGRITLSEADGATPKLHVAHSVAQLPHCGLVIEAIR